MRSDLQESRPSKIDGRFLCGASHKLADFELAEDPVDHIQRKLGYLPFDRYHILIDPAPDLRDHACRLGGSSRPALRIASDIFRIVGAARALADAICGSPSFGQKAKAIAPGLDFD
jgi:hypothetical protein